MDNSQKQQSLTNEAQMSQKQYYLREQILNQQYSPEQFIDYLNDKLHINSDLSQCTLHQLELIVKLFKKQKQQLKYSINNSHDDTMICDTITLVQQNSPKMIMINQHPRIFQEEYFSKIKCIKTDPRFSKNSIVCQINEPERIYEGGVLGIGESSYLCFKVWAYGLSEGFVHRRYGDFIWLRKILLKFFPGEIIPPIPNKKASKRQPRQILKRMRILTMFLNDLVKNYKFLNNKYVYSFLIEKNRKKFDKVKQEGQNVKIFESMLSSETQSGYVNLQLSKKSLAYKEFLNQAMPQVESAYKQVTRKSKQMKKLTADKINTIYEMANKFADIYGTFSKFNSKIQTQGLSKLTQIYCVLNNMMVEWGNSLKQQLEQIQKNLSTFFKYIRQELMGLKQLLKKQQLIQDQFIRQKQILDKQKQKIYQLHDPNKWLIPKADIKYIPKSAIYDKHEAFKIMLPKQSVKVNELKQQMAYYLSRIYQNGDRYFRNDADKFCQNFSQFVIRSKVNNQQIGAMWTQMSAKFSDPYKKIAQIKKSQNLLQSVDLSQYAESSYFD